MKPPVPGVGRLEEAERRDDLGVAGGAMTWSSVTSFSRRRSRVDLDLQLLVAQAPDRDVRDARDAHQPRPHRPAREDGSSGSA